MNALFFTNQERFVSFQQMKDRFTELQKSQQTFEKEQTNLNSQLENVKARKVNIVIFQTDESDVF
jgi:hypothetical protein